MPSPIGHPPYNKNGEGGRPPRFTKEFIDAEADELLLWLKEEKFTWFERFALNRGYDPALFSSWAEENERFKQAYLQAKARQKVMLIEGGLDKRFNFNMAQLLLGHSYGIFPKQETKISGSSEDPFHVMWHEVNGSTKDLVPNEPE